MTIDYAAAAAKVAPRSSAASTIIPGRGEQRFYQRQAPAADDPERQKKIDSFMSACNSFEILSRYRGLMSAAEWHGVEVVLGAAAHEVEHRRQQRKGEAG